MNKKVSLGAAIMFVLIACAITFSMTMIFSMRNFNNQVFNIRDREAINKKITEIDKVVRNNYIGAIDEETLNDSIARGLLSGTGDKYATYISKKQYQNLLLVQKGTIVGIGIDSAKDTSNFIKVVNVFKDSPADGAGIKGADLIIKINNKDVGAMSYDTAIESLNGEVGTKVSVTVRRGTDEINIDVLRRKYDYPSIETKTIGVNGYIKIKEFNQNTFTQFQKELNTMLGNKITGLIIDVRNNPGGTMGSAAQVLDMLLPAGNIVSSTNKSGQTKVLYKSDAKELSIPMVVLINQKSASASELLAQALRDYNKAKIVGVNSLGKGSMQNLFKLEDGSAVDITVAMFNPPKSPNFNGVGIKPDFDVKLSTQQELFFYELNEQTDPQLKKAVEVVESLKNK